MSENRKCPFCGNTMVCVNTQDGEFTCTSCAEYANHDVLDFIENLKAENERLKTELKEKHNTEVKELLCLISDKEKRFNRAFESEEKEIRHNKYKRCLAMAEWCNAEADVADADGDYDDMRWYQKWHTRWLEYAEIINPNKTTAQ